MEKAEYIDAIHYSYITVVYNNKDCYMEYINNYIIILTVIVPFNTLLITINIVIIVILTVTSLYITLILVVANINILSIFRSGSDR